MSGFGAGETEQWSFGYLISSQHPFFAVNMWTVLYTWAALIIIAGFLLCARYFISQKESLVRFFVLYCVRAGISMVAQALPSFSFNHFAFIISLFCFLIVCNTLSIIPWMEEPTTDINTPFSLGLISFFYVQISTIMQMGLWPYIKGYFYPFFVMLPLNILSRLAVIISMSVRLFGNIFGGYVISGLYFGALSGNVLFGILGLLSGFNFLITIFFGIFEGFLQAFVFTTLSLTYLSIGLQGEGH